MLVLMAANILAAVAPTFWVLAVARFVPGMVIPIFWGTASETAADLVGTKKAGKAVAHVYMGIAAGMVLGIPIGTLAATVVGWRGTFWGLSVLSLAIFGLLAQSMPSIAGNDRVHLSHQLKILHQPIFLAHLLLSVLVFTAMFTAYTYLADTLEKIAHVPSSQIGWWLMGFGVVGLVGNSFAAHFVGRHPMRPTIVAIIVLAISTVATDMWAHNSCELTIPLALWGMANTALFAISQVRVMSAASHAQALAGTLNVSMANCGIGLGAIMGGFVIENFGIQFLGLITSIIALLAIVLAIGIGRKTGKVAH
ncbi:major facilitator protein [Gluconobacter kanchanaburiensis NBRC 103587]|nr:major facilitator protein [Gluconobacter kanchanaburiensis NBRC 103587]